MTDHPRCATCVHWTVNEPTRFNAFGTRPAFVSMPDPPGWGRCRKADYGTPPTETTAIAEGYDQSGYLDTAPTHYCPMHSALAPS